MILIELYGPPGTGKSTGAAYIFSQLKMRGVNAELVTEFAKDKMWEKNDAALSNQAYMFGKQYFRITRCMHDVDVIVTDSPLMLSLIYNCDPVLNEEFNALVSKVSRSFDSRSYLLKRVKPYNPKGRLQTEAESDELVGTIKALLDNQHISYKTVDGNMTGYDQIVNDICAELNVTK